MKKRAEQDFTSSCFRFRVSRYRAKVIAGFYQRSSGEMASDAEYEASKNEGEKTDLLLAKIATSRGLQEADLIGLQEADIRLGLARKGYIRNVIVVNRLNKVKRADEYVAWVHPSWLRGFYLFCTHRARSMRSYKDPGLFFAHCRDDWGYRGVIMVLTHDDPKVTELQLAATRRVTRKVADLVGNEALLD